MRLFSFPTLRAARCYMAAEQALKAREHRRGNIIAVAGFDYVVGSDGRETPVLDIVAASFGRRDRPAAEMAVVGGAS